MRIINKRRTQAFGYLQLLATLAVVGIIATVGIVSYKHLHKATVETKLSGDATSLNAAVKMYLNSGGSLDGLTTAQEVIDQMKKDANNGDKIAGFSGGTVDIRLEAEPQTAAEAASGATRVIWDAASQKFTVATSGTGGIKAFTLNTTDTPTPPAPETRETTYELTTQTSGGPGTWVWDFDGDTPTAGLPTMTTLTADPNANVDQTNTNTEKTQLIMPSLADVPGLYPLPEYNSYDGAGNLGKLVTITNPNDPATSELRYAVNSGAWNTIASGGQVSVPPGGTVAAYANVIPAAMHLHYTSFVRGGGYDATTMDFTAPSISVSPSGNFHPLTSEQKTVTITHSNDPLHGVAEYSLDDGNTWTNYTVPFTMEIDSHPNGATILARVKAAAWPDYYHNSPTTTENIDTDTLDLVIPVIALENSAGQPVTGFNPFTATSATVIITNPNDPLGSVSKIEYSVNGAPWADYDDANRPVLSIPNTADPAQVRARAVATVHLTTINNSPEADAAVPVEHENLVAPSIVATDLHPVTSPDVNVTITTNDPAEADAVTKLVYRLSPTDDWADYSAGGIALNIGDHPNGVNVEAQSVATSYQGHITNSSLSQGNVSAATVTLNAPVIATMNGGSAVTQFHPIDMEDMEVSVSLDGGDDPAYAELVYSLDDGSNWLPYDDADRPDLNIGSFPNKVMAEVRPKIYPQSFNVGSAEQALSAVTVQLQDPQIAVAPSSFNPLTAQAVTVSLTEPSVFSADHAQLQYSTNDGADWLPYDDADKPSLDLLDFLGDVSVSTRTVATANTAYLLNSQGNVAQTVTVQNATLAAPSISGPSILSPQGGFSTASMTIDMAGNPAAFSTVVYTVDDGATWVDYIDPFDLTVAAYPNGVTVKAKAIAKDTPVQGYITGSPEVSHTLTVPPVLQAPTFDLAEGGYVKSTYNSGITITNPNASGGAHELRYRVNDGPWEVYTTPVVVTTWPTELEAQVFATDFEVYQDSSAFEGDYERIWLAAGLTFEAEGSSLPYYLHEFTGESIGEFVNPTGGSGLVAIIESNYFEWGSSHSSVSWDTGSWLEYTGYGWEDVQVGEMFRLGTLDYFNGTINSGSGADEVQLDLTINLSLPDVSETFAINLGLINSQNTDNADESADSVLINNLTSNFTTEVDGIQYQLNLAFGYNGNSGFSSIDEFHVHEGATATADLWGSFSSIDF